LVLLSTRTCIVAIVHLQLLTTAAIVLRFILFVKRYQRC
jgi:hypothetical protein